VSLAGCTPTTADHLVIATDLPVPECARLADAFTTWLASRHGPPVPGHISWLRGRPGEDPARLVERGASADLILGGTSTSFERLAAAGRLDSTGPPWRIFRRVQLGWTTTPSAIMRLPKTWAGAGAPNLAGRIALDDPRRDPTTLILAEAALAKKLWPPAYARLIHAFRNAPRIGPRHRAALCRLERGVDTCAPSEGDARPFVPWPAIRSEGVGILKVGPHPELARRFLAFLAERGEAADPKPQDLLLDPGAEALLADLLGATLVDAHAELVPAIDALEKAKRPDLAQRWLTPPPWPPASVRKLSQKDPTGALVEELAGQIAPDLDVRIWLLESWGGAERVVDGPLLEALAHAVDGKLVDEPRLRAWLRGEWSAWARQNYRRIVRQLRGQGTPP
jgi:ABC-type Fe3+ transport system substrate-binding protein